MMGMGGKRQRKVESIEDDDGYVPCIQKGQDPHMIYQAQCVELAEDIAWDFESVVYHWSQIALARMSCGEPQGFAEFMAMQNLREELGYREQAAD